MFHGPVRDGKEWCHLAMAARHKRELVDGVYEQKSEHSASGRSVVCGFDCVVQTAELIQLIGSSRTGN